MKKMNKILLVFMSAFVSMNASAINTDSKVDSTRQYVKGIVVDAVTGKPIQGVSVSAGKNISVLTDERGAYRLPVVSYDQTISMSAPGYATLTVPLQGAHEKDAKIFSSEFTKKADSPQGITATSSMSVDEVLGGYYGADARIVSRGSLEGVGANLFVRGYHSVNLNTQPLVVIDGVVRNTDNVSSAFEGFYINALADLDISNIEHVTILKDASSLYGAKGANGAILIETHRGKSTTTKIDLNMNWGVNFMPKTLRMMDGYNFRSFASDVLKGLKGNAIANTFEDFLNDEADLTKNISYSTYHNNHNWKDDVYQNAFRQYYGLNVEGGDYVAKYALSASYMQGKGVVKATDYDRLVTHFSADIKLSHRLNVGANFDFTHFSRQLSDNGVNEYTSAPYISLIKSSLVTPYRYSNDGIIYTSNLSDVDAFGVSNPVSLIQNGIGKYTSYRFGVNLKPTYQVNDWMDISENFAYNMNAVKEHYYSPVTGIASQVLADGSIYTNTVKDQSINQGQLFSDTRVHFNPVFDKIHALDVALGLRIMTNSYKSNYGEGHNTGSDKVVNLSTNLEGKVIDGLKTTLRNAAAYLNVAYDFNQKYGVWAHLTEEASNSFGNDVDGAFRLAGGSWATFPSAGAHWNVSNERFMSALPWVNRFDLHASWGLTGNDGMDILSRYAYLTPVIYFGKATGLQIGNEGNESLKWETTRKVDYGFDLSLFNDRLTLSANFYHHKTSDLLMYSDADLLSGLSASLKNGGTMTNTGFDVSLGYRLVNLKALKWNVEAGFAHYKNELTSMPGGEVVNNVGNGAILLKEGLPLGTFYGYKTVSDNGSIVFATEQQAQEANLKTWNNSRNAQLTYHAGDVHFADLDGNGLIDESDRTVIGDANPDLTGSLYNHLAAGRFALDIMFTYSLGNDIYNYQRHSLETMKNLYNQTEAIGDRWRYDGQVTNIPRAVYNDPMNNSRFSDRWIEDGSYLKLKNVRLTYQIPHFVSFLQGASAWVEVNNLYTWTKYLGPDPEVSYGTSPLTQGVDYGVTSGNRSLLLGLKLNF